MTQLLQILVSSLVPASTDALVAVGLVILFRSSRVLNFAQGAMVLVGAYIFASFLQRTNQHVGLALGATLVCAACIGVLMYELLLKPVHARGPLILIMFTILLGYGLEAITVLIWGASPIFLPQLLGSPVALPLGISLSQLNVGIIATTALLIAALAAVLRLTNFGIGIRAAAENPVLAAYRGINVANVGRIVWGTSMTFASLAGVALGLQSQVSPDLADIGTVVFPAILLGGLDSIVGALVGSVILGVIQTLTEVFLNGTWVNPVTYLVLLAVLIVKPTGLFGSREIGRL